MGIRVLRSEEIRTVAWRTGFRVGKMAAHFGMDLRTFQRVCEEQLLVSPKSLAMKERMNAALPLLAAGFTNKEIADQLLYQHPSTFCREFRRYFGCAPQVYLRERFMSRATESFVAFG